MGALSAALVIGVAPLALTNLAWDQGFRRGDSRLLAVMAYVTPVLSALLLIGAAMIVGSGLLSCSDGQ